MELKDARRNIIPQKASNFLLGYLKHHKLWLGFIVLMLYSSVLLLAGAAIHKTGVIGRVIKPSIKANVRVPINYLRGLRAKPEHIYIDMKHKEYQKLVYYRERVLKEACTPEAGSACIPNWAKVESVNAKLTYKGKVRRAKIRLTGWYKEHIESDKWSLRVKIKDNKTVMGMSEFNLQHPCTRNYIDEWIINELERREGIIALRFDFVDVTINGKHRGIYLIEEHFDQELMEHNKRREGLLFRATMKIFQEKRNLKKPALAKQMAILQDIYTRFVNKKLSTSEVFDVDKLAAHYALSDLVNGYHQHSVANAFYYFNPITNLIEPIGRERNPVTGLGYLAGELKHAHTIGQTRRLFKDPVFFKRYIEELERISQKKYLDAFFEENKANIKNKLNILYKEYPYVDFSKDIYYKNQEIIRKKLHPSRAIEVKYQGIKKGILKIKVRNICSLPIEIISASSFDYIISKPLNEIVLWPSQKPETTKYQEIEFALPKDYPWSPALGNLKLNFRVFGTSGKLNTIVSPLIYNDIVRQKPNYYVFDFISIDDSTKTISIKPGKWTLSENLIIPKEYTLVCPEGVQINLVNSSKILSWGPLHFIGSKKAPIIITSEDSSGQGVVVLKAGEKSHLEYVIFRNLSAPKEIGWELTGAVTFYESPVKILHCQFVNSQSEDALNIIHSDFEIDNTLFKKTLSDAFDADFSEGRITNSSFADCGNDAIDISGSIVELNNIFINGAGDKGLSVGEDSKMAADNIEIKNARIAAASKDMSELNINNATMSDCKIAFAVYQKKSEFGPASIIATKSTADKIATPYLIEEGSKLNVNGKVVNFNEKSLKGIVY